MIHTPFWMSHYLKLTKSEVNPIDEVYQKMGRWNQRSAFPICIMRQLKDFFKHYASHAAKVMMPKCLILFCACLAVGNKPSAMLLLLKGTLFCLCKVDFSKDLKCHLLLCC